MNTIALPFSLPSKPRLRLAILLLCIVIALGLLTYITYTLQSSQEAHVVSSPFTTPAMRILPILHQGRFRPMEAYSRLWLEERYGSPFIHQRDISSFPGSDGSALDVLWRWMLHQESLMRAPLFWISPHIRTGLERTQHPAIATTTATPSTHLSYQQIQEMLQGKGPSSTLVWHLLIAHHAKALPNSPEPVELRSLAHGLFVKRKKDTLHIVKLPSKPFSTPLHVGEEIVLSEMNPREIQAWIDLIRLWIEPKEWKLIPPHTPGTPGENWSSQAQAPEEIRNIFKHAQEYAQAANDRHASSQLSQVMQTLSTMLHMRYEPLAGNPSLSAPSLTLHYPTWGQLWAESVYVRFPGIFILLVCYACGTGALACFLLWEKQKQTRKRYPHYLYTIGWLFLSFGWIVHTLLLLTRCYILGRPPVANMFETVLYVPWIGMLIGWILAYYSTLGTKTLVAASCSAFILLSLIPLTGMRGGMENVQAVLDSRFWLIIHVLMVVGSYGAFFVSGLLAHGFLVRHFFSKKSQEHAQNAQHIQNTQNLSNAILLTLYIGVALLIPGTLLGGVWAAQSWGRFWDWDPKESWACITSCIYLFVIHLHRFGRIQALGLSFGSIIGLLAVSFTWYGVNYLLGVGLHSYGFGHGGETAYLMYLFAECLFLALCALYSALVTVSVKATQSRSHLGF